MRQNLRETLDTNSYSIFPADWGVVLSPSPSRRNR